MFLEELMLALCLRHGVKILIFGNFPNLTHIILVEVGTRVEFVQCRFASANAGANVWPTFGFKLDRVTKWYSVKDFIFNLNHTYNYDRLRSQGQA